jgi:hypothetical protein
MSHPRARRSIPVGVLPLVAGLIATAAPAQTGPSGRTMVERAPAVLGQTALFEMTHPAGAAGNAYAFLASVPPYAPATPVAVPGLVVLGAARVNPLSSFTAFAGVLGATGSVVHALPVPASPAVLGFGFDLQSLDLSLATGTLAFADNDLTVAVQSRQWQTPSVVGTGAMGQPRIAVRPQGTAVALWCNGTTAPISVHASTWQPGVGWSASVPVSSGHTATEVAMAMDAAGDVVAVWREVGNDSIWSSRLDAATGTWSAQVELETSLGYAGNPQVAVDAAGNAIAVWWQYDAAWFNGLVSLVACRYTPGIGWGSPTAIENDAQGHAGPPTIACDASGNATAVWLRAGLSGGATVWSNRFVPGTGWVGAGPITSDVDVNGTVPPEVAVDGNGDAIVIWETMGSPYREIHTSRRTGSGAGTWTPTLRLDPTTTIMSDTPKVAVLGVDGAIAVWSEHDGTRYHVMFSRFVASTGWSPAAIAATDPATWCRLPELAVDGLGGAVITWYRGQPGVPSTCWSSRLPAGGVWSAPVQIDGNNHSGLAGVALGADAGGRAFALMNVYGAFTANTLLGNEYR